MDAFTLLLSSYGLCFGLMYRANFVTAPLKRIQIFIKDDKTFFERLFECPFCTGFHSGYITWICSHYSNLNLEEVIQFGFASSAFCFALDTLIVYWESHANR